jgi:hypothetical protein
MVKIKTKGKKYITIINIFLIKRLLFHHLQICKEQIWKDQYLHKITFVPVQVFFRKWN